VIDIECPFVVEEPLRVGPLRDVVQGGQTRAPPQARAGGEVRLIHENYGGASPNGFLPQELPLRAREAAIVRPALSKEYELPVDYAGSHRWRS
jgi:hypothetical protein